MDGVPPAPAPSPARPGSDAAEPATSEPAADEDPLARSTGLLQPPSALSGAATAPEGDVATAATAAVVVAARRRVPSHERLTEQPPVAVIEMWEREYGRELGRERPHDRDDVAMPQPSRPMLQMWRGFLEDYEMARMHPGPLSVTATDDDYATNVGEGSVAARWESQALRNERLYRLQRPNHTPPPEGQPLPTAPPTPAASALGPRPNSSGAGSLDRVSRTDDGNDTASVSTVGGGQATADSHGAAAGSGAQASTVPETGPSDVLPSSTSAGTTAVQGQESSEPRSGDPLL